MASIKIVNGTLINDGRIKEAEILIKEGRIEEISSQITKPADEVIDAAHKYVIPGLIDDQVHFREPGLTHKADLASESKAGVAGGVTTFMEMPNTKPPAVTRELLEEKYARASQVSWGNYSFYMGTTNQNQDEVLRTDPRRVCGIKIFMGSSTGNMLVDDEHTLRQIFAEAPTLMAVHCEDEQTIRRNSEKAKEKYGDEVPISLHPVIRSEEACYLSSSFAVGLAREYGTQLHVLHISTAKELELFTKQADISKKNITSEACIHHIWFSDRDYASKGTHIKWNPAVKTKSDREAIRAAIKDHRIDIIATDHAPHTLAEKSNSYFQAPSGGPLVQHGLPAMLELCKEGEFELPLVIEKMCHAPAKRFAIENRGYLEEGFWADVVIVDPQASWMVNRENLLYKCGWSPFEGETFHNQVTDTIVSGNWIYRNGTFQNFVPGKRLLFDRK